jgi:hypothetical protein
MFLVFFFFSESLEICFVILIACNIIMGVCDLVFQVQIVMCFVNVGCLRFIFISF